MSLVGAQPCPEVSRRIAARHMQELSLNLSQNQFHAQGSPVDRASPIEAYLSVFAIDICFLLKHK